jgi:prolyl oligopeptidase PreP (S9A serine peptidase family)
VILDRRIIARLQVPWEYNGRSYPSGSLVALKLEDMSAEPVFAPEDHPAIDDVAIGKTDLHIELLENVAGKIKRASRGPDGWAVTDKLSVEKGGSVSFGYSSGPSGFHADECVPLSNSIPNAAMRAPSSWRCLRDESVPRKSVSADFGRLMSSSQ